MDYLETPNLLVPGLFKSYIIVHLFIYELQSHLTQKFGIALYISARRIR